MYWENGFYDKPKDGRVEITEERYRDLLIGQNKGLRIRSDESGHPQLYTRTGELYDGNPNDYDITLEPSYIEAQRVEGVKAQIETLKAQLKDLDYKNHKYAEMVDKGLTPDYTLSDIYDLKEPLRVQIRELEAQL